MLTDEARRELEKEQYRIVGSHSAVKICGWTKNMIRGRGECYKYKFYGIRSNQCIQMSPSLSCANRCVFCWRSYKAPISKNWKWGVDDPKMIADEIIKEHHKLLLGFKGSKTANKRLYNESKNARHVAMSLTGEAIIYPRINELVDIFHKKKISTFVVTNGQYPEEMRNLKPVTQLYLSLDAPTRDLLKKVDVPLFQDYWERAQESLKVISEKKQRTAIRITLVKGLNDVYPEKYAELVRKADPDFLEVKAYMHVGESRKRLSRENMPLHSYVKEFAQKINKNLEDYDMVSEHKPSRVVLLAKKYFRKKDGWHTWIDFVKFFELVDSGKDFSTEDYLKKTPEENIC